MTRNILLDSLSSFTNNSVKDIILPIKMQKGDTEQKYRAANVHKMRLPDSSAATKKAPYILHQVLTGKDQQTPGNNSESKTVIRSIFCVYNDNEEEGSLMLLNLMERLRIDLLKSVVVGNQFTLDLEAGLETLVYPEDTAPYYAGEMISTWKMPAIEREVIL